MRRHPVRLPFHVRTTVLGCVVGCVGLMLLATVSQADEVLEVNFDPGENPYVAGLVNKTSRLNTSLGLGTTSPAAVVLNLINTALSLLGTVSLVLLVYGGFLWVWARGNSEQIDKAKEIIRGTVIGLIIVFASLGITQYVFFTVGDITGATTANIIVDDGAGATHTGSGSVLTP